MNKIGWLCLVKTIDIELTGFGKGQVYYQMLLEGSSAYSAFEHI
jgi:hypothetical protein